MPAWPDLFITIDEAGRHPLAKLAKENGAVLSGRSCVVCVPTGDRPASEPKKGSWVFLRSASSIRYFSALYNPQDFKIAISNDDLLKVFTSSIEPQFSGTDLTIPMWEAFSLLLDEDTVWIPRKEGCSQKWKAFIPDDQVITWVQYTLEVPTFSAALPAHKIAIISSPANANGYFQAGGSASCVAIGAATARALEQLGAEFEPAISADAGAIAEAVDRLVD